MRAIVMRDFGPPEVLSVEDVDDPAPAPEQVVVDVEFVDAMALLADGRTALGLIEQAAVQPGETVLIEAAAGGVGSCLVQLALARGATVRHSRWPPQGVCVHSSDRPSSWRRPAVPTRAMEARAAIGKTLLRIDRERAAAADVSDSS